jgi:hypothetical protein
VSRSILYIATLIEYNDYLFLSVNEYELNYPIYHRRGITLTLPGYCLAVTFVHDPERLDPSPSSLLT